MKFSLIMVMGMVGCAANPHQKYLIGGAVAEPCYIRAETRFGVKRLLIWQDDAWHELDEQFISRVKP